MPLISVSDKTVSRKNLKNVKRPYCAEQVLIPSLANDDRTPLFGAMIDGREVFITSTKSHETILEALIEANATGVREFLHGHCVEPLQETYPACDGITWTVDQVDYDKQTKEWTIVENVRPETVESYPAGITTAPIDHQIQPGRPDPEDFVARLNLTLKFPDTDRAKSCQAWLASKYKIPAGALIVAPDETWIVYPFAFNQSPEEKILADGREKLAMLQAPIRKRLQEVSSFPIFDGTDEADRLLAELVRLSAESGREIDDELETLWANDEPLDDDDQYRIDHGDSRHCRRFIEAIASRYGIDIAESIRLDASVPLPIIGSATEIITDPDYKKWFLPVKESQLAEIADELDEEFSLWNPGGLIQQIINYNLATCYKPQPEMAMFGALALCSTINGQKVQDERGIRPNIMVAGLADSGSGKEHARQVNKMILARAGGERMLSDNLASDVGLLKQMSRSPSSLIQLDELGRMLATLDGASKNPHLFKIKTKLMQLFTSAGTVFLGENHSDAKNDITVHNPNCTVFGTTVPGSFFNSLDKESLSDGFLNRWLVFEASNNDPDPTDDPANIEDVPPELIESIKWWLAYQPASKEGLPQPARRLIATDAAKAEYKKLETAARSKHRLEADRGTQIWSRCYEYSRKLGLLHQLSLDRDATTISVESARWGCKLAIKLTSRIQELTEEHISDGQFDATGKKLVRFIKLAGDAGRSLSQVSRHVRNLPRRDVTECLDKLIEVGDIVKEPRQAAKGPATIIYRSIA